MAAEHLLRLDGVGEADIGEDAFQHRRQQAEPVVGALARRGVGRTMRLVARQSRPHHRRARRFIEGADFEQHAPDVGMDEDRIGGLAGVPRAGQRAALQTLLGIGGGVLIGDFGKRRAPCSATPMRASFIITNMALRPRFSSPISQPLAPS